MSNNGVLDNLVRDKETVVREYDGKLVTWSYMLMPIFVDNYKKIQKKEYCNPFFWIITDVTENVQ
tara:strand:+ start:2464 stop:2658 length:195 start_codon:yes stop_codon:yes gene_type:complete